MRVSGFTLIELIVAVAVLAITLALGVPSFRDLIVNNRLVTQANDLLLDLVKIRGEAIRRNAPVSFCPKGPGNTCGTDWKQGMLVFVDYDQTLDAGCEIDAAAHDGYPADLVLYSTEARGHAIQVTEDRVCLGFNSLGARTRPTGGLVTVTLCDDGANKSKNLTLGPVGRASVEKGQGAC